MHGQNNIKLHNCKVLSLHTNICTIENNLPPINLLFETEISQHFKPDVKIRLAGVYDVNFHGLQREQHNRLLP